MKKLNVQTEIRNFSGDNILILIQGAPPIRLETGEVVSATKPATIKDVIIQSLDNSQAVNLEQAAKIGDLAKKLNAAEDIIELTQEEKDMIDKIFEEQSTPVAVAYLDALC